MKKCIMCMAASHSEDFEKSYTMVGNNTGEFLRTNLKRLAAEQELSYLRSHVNSYRKRLMDFCDSIEQEAQLEYTGWFVLVKKEGDAWKCVGTYNPNVSEEDEEPDWDICLPIPTLETINKFQGW